MPIPCMSRTGARNTANRTGFSAITRSRFAVSPDWAGLQSPTRICTEAHQPPLRWAQQEGLPLRILGGGSNLVIADPGVDALVLRMNLRGIEMRPVSAAEVWVTAAAGEP